MCIPTIAIVLSIFAPPPASQPAEADPRALGRKLIEGLPPIRLGVERTSFLESRSGEKPNGVSRGRLRPEEAKDGSRHYEYENVSIMRGADDQTLEVITRGRLDRWFMPLEMNWTVRRYSKDGKVSVTSKALRMSENEIVLTRTSDEAEPVEKRRPRPEGRFVYFTGDLLGLLSFEPDMVLTLRELDPETCKVISSTLRTKRKEDGRLRIGVTRSPSKVETDYFIMDEDGYIAEHGIHGPQARFERTSPVRAEAIEKAIRRYLPRPGSQMP